jgi:hypothetical protein
MSLIKIDDLFKDEVGVLTTVTDREVENVVGGGGTAGYGGAATASIPAPSYYAVAAPVAVSAPATPAVPNPQNTLNNYGTAVSYAFARSQYQPTSAGNFALTVGGQFAGGNSVSATQQPFTSDVYWYGSYPVKKTVK